MKNSKPLSPEKERKKKQPKKELKELNWWNQLKRQKTKDKDIV